MKKLLLIALLFIPCISKADVYVDGYTKQNGSYVQPHYRSNPDSSRYNNYSYTGNSNPYTGSRGTQSPSAAGRGSSSHSSFKTYRDNGGNVDIHSDGSFGYMPR